MSCYDGDDEDNFIQLPRNFITPKLDKEVENLSAPIKACFRDFFLRKANCTLLLCPPYKKNVKRIMKVMKEYKPDIKANWLHIVDYEVYDLLCSGREIVGVNLGECSTTPDFLIMNVREVIINELDDINDFIKQTFKKISDFGQEQALSVLNFILIDLDQSSTLSIAMAKDKGASC